MKQRREHLAQKVRLYTESEAMSEILIIDDHSLVRDGMRLLLEGLDPTVSVFEAGSCEEGLEQLGSVESLELVLLDLSLPGTSGLGCIARIREQFPDTPIIIFSASEKSSDARAVLDAGVEGYIPKAASGEVVLSAIRLVLSGGTYFPTSMVLAEQQEDELSAVVEKPVQLTPRQLDVLKLLAQGKPNKLIADALDMAESTVRVHATAIFKALEVTNRTEAAYAAVRLGLIVSSESDGNN